MEKINHKTGQKFTWNDDLSLSEILENYKDVPNIVSGVCDVKGHNNTFLLKTDTCRHDSNDAFTYIKEKRQ